MDRETMEYMDNRVKKAKEIVSRIDDLTNRIEGIKTFAEVTFKDMARKEEFTASIIYSSRGPSEKRMIKKIREFTIKMICEEITLLEQELEEI